MTMTPEQLNDALEKACKGKRLGFSFPYGRRGPDNDPLGYLCEAQFPTPSAVIHLLNLSNEQWEDISEFVDGYESSSTRGPFARLGLQWRERALKQMGGK